EALTLEQARAIYDREYYQRIHGDELPEPLAYVMLDAAVHDGVDSAIRFLQVALHVPVDGIFGSQTLAAIRNFDLVAVIDGAVLQRARVLAGRFRAGKPLKYLQGFWLRTLHVMMNSHRM